MTQLITLSLIIFALQLPFNVTAETSNSSWTNVFKFQQKMAHRGSVNAQYILGEMYEEGRGVEQSNDKAIEWYTKAQRNGHQDAAIRITQIKLRIANKELEAKEAKLKAQSKKRLSVKPKAEEIPAPPKKVHRPKVKAAVVEAATQPIVQKVITKPAQPAKPKVKRFIASPNNLERGKGTHLDIDEEDSPFE